MALRDRKLSDLRLIEQAQPRERIDLETVADYKEALLEGGELPPIVVFGSIVADGFHRYLAHQSAGRKMIPTLTHEGGEREAVLYSCGANATHGLRRTNADKRKAVSKILSDKKWSEWSDRRVATVAKVSHTFVSQLRASGNGFQVPTRRKVERDGKEYLQDVRLRADKPKPKTDHTTERALRAIESLAQVTAPKFLRSLDEQQSTRLQDALPAAQRLLDTLSGELGVLRPVGSDVASGGSSRTG